MTQSKFDWQSMSIAEKQAFIRDSIEERHKEMYQLALRIADRTGPSWEELTEERRDIIRKANDRYESQLHEFGKSLRFR